MYAIYGNIYHQYTPNVSIYTIHGSYGIYIYIYPLVNIQKTMENHHAINGKTHYFYGHVQWLC